MSLAKRYEEFTGSPPGGLRCHVCGAPADKKCSKCHVTRYCSEACQRAHWPHHKAACKVDRKAPAPDFEADVFRINDRCLHGAPASSTPAGQAAQSLCMKILPTMGSGDSTAELAALVHYVKANPAAARNPGLPRALASMSLDAFGNNDGGIARTFLRAANFIEEFAAHGEAFLLALHSSVADQPALRGMNAFLENTLSRSGLIEALRLRTTCTCLAPGC